MFNCNPVILFVYTFLAITGNIVSFVQCIQWNPIKVLYGTLLKYMTENPKIIHGTGQLSSFYDLDMSVYMANLMK